MLSVLDHIDRKRPLQQYVAIPARIDETRVLEVSPEDLSPGWQGEVPRAALQRIGDTWAEEQASLCLRVPSAILPLQVYEREHNNYIVNPQHPEAGALEIGEAISLPLDARLLEN